MEWGDCGTTFIVDKTMELVVLLIGLIAVHSLEKNFDCRVILDTTENSFYNFFVKEDIKIDYLHIDQATLMMM